MIPFEGRARIDPTSLALGTRALTYHGQSSSRNKPLEMRSGSLTPYYNDS